MKRRHFLALSATSAAGILQQGLFPSFGSFLAAPSSTSRFDLGNRNLPTDVVAILQQLSNAGVEKYRVTSKADPKALYQLPLFEINSSYGRLSNIDLAKGINSENVYLITRGPAGKKMRNQFPQLNVISKYSHKLTKFEYLTDAAPHYWNNLHRNSQAIYKTYFIDSSTRKSVQLYLNIYAVNANFVQTSDQLKTFTETLQSKYVEVEKQSLKELSKKYNIVDLSILTNKVLKIS